MSGISQSFHFVCIRHPICVTKPTIIISVYVFCISYLVRIMRVDYPGQPEVSDLEQQLVCVDEYVGRLQISVQDVS